MKINQSYWKDNADDNKNDRRADWVAQSRRHAVKNEETAAAKQRQVESSFKEETKFSGILEATVTSQKVKQTNDDTGEERREDEKKDKKSNAARDKDSADSAAVENRVERNGSSFGGNFGGGNNFGGDVGQTVHLSENFAARSILHIADLERMVSAVRKLTKLDGKREITLELKRSVLEGLKVKIAMGDASQVQIEFLAANEKVRSQIENHSEELANILRGRGVNLQFLRASIDGGGAKDSEAFKLRKTFSESKDNNSSTENTFDGE